MHYLINLVKFLKISSLIFIKRKKLHLSINNSNFSLADFSRKMAQKTKSYGLIDDFKAIFSTIPNTFTYSSNLLEFYSVFISEKALLSAEIPSHEKVYAKNFKPYTVYNIKIRTKTHEFIISKRYKDFLSLHQNIKKKYHNLIKDCQFPEKTFFWDNFDNFVVETRRILFQQYLQTLVEGYASNNIIEFLDFLEIHSKIFLLIFKLFHFYFFRDFPC